MEEKYGTTYDTVPHPCREKRRLYHHQKSLSLWSPWNTPTAGHPDQQLVRSGCHNWGSLGEEGGCEGGRPPAPSPSPLHVFAVHCIYSY